MNKESRAMRIVAVGIILLLVAGCQAAESPTSTTSAAVPSIPQQPVTVTTKSPQVAPATDEKQTVTEEATGQSKANADVMFVRAVQAVDGSWVFYVTVNHPDTGWENYADGWDVVTPEGIVLKSNPEDPFTRLLLHPHENEQPFTRSQSGIVIPEGIMLVVVRAHDLVDGYGGREVSVDLAAGLGPDYEVERP